MKKYIVTAACLSVSFFSGAGDLGTQEIGDDLVQRLGGYTQIKIDTDLEQRYPLLKVVNHNFPSSVRYVGQALNYALNFSGYSLGNLKLTNEETLKLYSLKLPLTNRQINRATTLQVIETIVGSGFDVSVNEESRIITILPTEND